MTDRNLMFRIQTAAELGAVEDAAAALEDLGRTGDTARRPLDELGRSVDDLGSSADSARTDVETLDRAVSDVDLDKLGTEARDAAREVDQGFDKMARSSKQSAATIDTETSDVKRSFGEVGEEAQGTAREMAASFDGSAGSVLDAFQELGANAGVAFGPIAAAAGIAATVGVGYIRAEQEKLKTMTTELTQAMLDAGGQLTEAAIDARVTAAATEDPAAFVKQKQVLDDLGISWRDYTRAKAGDGEAARRAIQQIADLSTQITDQAAASGSASGAMAAQQTKLNELAGDLGVTATAYDIAKAATEGVEAATSSAGDELDQAKRSTKQLRDELDKPLTADVRINKPSAADFNRIRSDINDGIGPIVVDVRLPSDLFSRPRN